MSLNRVLACVGICAVILGALAACDRSYVYHYRLTVTVRDHGKLLTSSNVVRVHEFGRSSRQPRLCGEANVLRLSDGRYLFALLNGEPQRLIRHIASWDQAPTGILLQRLGLNTEWRWGKDDSGIQALPDMDKEVDLDPYQMPEFVTFRSNDDPKSAVVVDPRSPAATLGPGITIERVSIRPTRESSTSGEVRRALSWFDPDQDYIKGKYQMTHGNHSITNLQSYQFERCSWFSAF